MVELSNIELHAKQHMNPFEPLFPGSRILRKD